MGEAILHIGLAKTGSTAIQAMLYRNQEFVADAGWHYPAFLNRQNHVQLAAYGASDDHHWTHRMVGAHSVEEFHRFRKEFEAEFRKATRKGNWVFTSEHIASRLLDEDSVGRLAQLLERFDRVRVVMYVRRQDEMAVASHSTWARDGQPHPFWIDRHLKMANRYDYRLIAERWTSVFGSDAVEIRLYPARDVVDDFLALLDIDPASAHGLEQPPRTNVSLTDAELAFLRAMNHTLPRWADDRPTHLYADFSHLIIEGSGIGERLRLDPAHRRAILDRFRESNEWVLERAANAEGNADYFDPEIGDEPANVDRDLTTDELTEFAAILWRHASELRTNLDTSQQRVRDLERRLDER